MIRMASGVTCLWCVLASALAAATGSPQDAARKPPAIEGGLAQQRSNLPPRTSTENRWRYSFRNGHWWYYRDGGRWAYWTGDRWYDYDPKSYHRWYINQRMADLNDDLARFDARTLRPYMDGRFPDLGGGPAYLPQSGPYPAVPGLPGYGAGSVDLFYRGSFDGRLNPATSTGGYMGGALRGPFGY
ncbi:MAG TPA: hypothetical protein VG826_33720 [Pirellulales bacterium]|nr:hypothetical protein [Pirellulales bacterium]